MKKKIIREINKEKMDKNYNEYLIKLVQRMLNEEINNRPTSNQCYDELEQIEKIIENPNDNYAKKFLQKKNEPNYTKPNSQDISNNNKNTNINKININNNNKYNQQIPQNNQNYNNSWVQNNINYSNIYTNQVNNNYNRSGSANYTQTYQIPYQVQPTFINNQYLYGQSYVYQNYNNNFPNQYMNSNYQNIQIPNNFRPTVNQNNIGYMNIFKNSSLVSILQCVYSCFKEGLTMKNLEFTIGLKIKQNKNLFSFEIYNILKLMSNISSNVNQKNNFVNSIQNFRSKASEYISCLKGNDEIDPLFVFLGLSNYMNNEFRETGNLYMMTVFNDDLELENLPKNKFPHIYKTINEFKEKNHSPFANLFYYILLNLKKCPNCNSVLEANIYRDSGILCFIPLPGNKMDKVSNLINNYISKQDNSEKIYKCEECYYEGPGKKEKGFINTPKYLLISFEGNRDINILNPVLDLTNYSIGKIGPKKYDILAFITKEFDKYKAYIKNEKNWFAYTDENVAENANPLLDNCIPYIAIYEGED